jgi:tRNA threonylcarbamoyladenosine biosynthesis protein TsaE
VVYLSGELGAGKTTLVQGIARGFGIDGFVRSSSFMLVNEYEGRSIKLYHIDLYRLESGQAEGFGLEEYINDRGSVSLIEWADRLTGTTVSPDWEIHLSWQSESTRKIGIHQCRKNRNRP